MSPTAHPPPRGHIDSAIRYTTPPTGTFHTLLALGWALRGKFTMWDVADWVRTHRAEFTGKPFAILEDAGQAFYTSGHALEQSGIDTLSPDTPGLHPDSIKDGYVDLHHPSEFPIRLKGFRDYLTASAEDPLPQNDRYWNDEPGSLLSLDVATASKEVYPVDRLSFVMDVPVTQAADAIAAFPNGYFSCDLQANHNHALANQIEAAVGLEIFGLGATYAGYSRDTPLSEAEAGQLADILRPLYTELERPERQFIIDLATGQHTLFFAYGGG